MSSATFSFPRQIRDYDRHEFDVDWITGVFSPPIWQQYLRKVLSSEYAIPMPIQFFRHSPQLPKGVSNVPIEMKIPHINYVIEPGTASPPLILSLVKDSSGNVHLFGTYKDQKQYILELQTNGSIFLRDGISSAFPLQRDTRGRIVINNERT